MALTIKENNGAYQLEGVLNVNTANHFLTHCEILLNAFGKLTIDIEKTSLIDSDGMRAIKSLFANANTSQRKFYVIGTGCKDIYDDMRTTNTAA
ncbi:hypothetical protein BTO05_11265 [Winogradskyella sp. PC-19]|uniref:STAS domain-containing protein n=1 Tax=unclassified Winogradskyella TaxID=2615021 RepID=UPI000B3D1DA5|nr:MULTISPECIES: STAS domain-containing protein [unclassified Winogradskyella]ARV10186.1 hypothetical protein BTO05_11265 [Winogradskyella sp. PC-19]RZN83175.1 MAG: hypothetical protein EVB12_02025 [Winogradskyella sp.]